MKAQLTATRLSIPRLKKSRLSNSLLLLTSEPSLSLLPNAVETSGVPCLLGCEVTLPPQEGLLVGLRLPNILPPPLLHRRAKEALLLQNLKLTTGTPARTATRATSCSTAATASANTRDPGTHAQDLLKLTHLLLRQLANVLQFLSELGNVNV